MRGLAAELRKLLACSWVVTACVLMLIWSTACASRRVARLFVALCLVFTRGRLAVPQ
jgi:hypothetical protein